MTREQRIRQIKGRLNKSKYGGYDAKAVGKLGYAHDRYAAILVSPKGVGLTLGQPDADFITAAASDIRWLLKEINRLKG